MNITKDYMFEEYYINNLNLFEIAQKTACDYKIIRGYMNLFEIPIKEQKTLNLLFHKSYNEPNLASLLQSNSIIAHSIYLCEGWHTEKTNQLIFTNQNVNLIFKFTNCLFHIYDYNKPVFIEICYNFTCEKSLIQAIEYKKYFENNKLYNVYMNNDSTRKNAILRVKAGGNNLSNLFIHNAYKILNFVT